MRILYYHQFFGIPKGAVGTRSYEFARRLVEMGHEVTMVCGSLANSDTGLTGPFVKGRRSGVVDGIRVIEFDLPVANKDSFVKRGVSYVKFGLKSIGVALTHEYDLVFATSTPLTAGIPGIVAKVLRRKSFVFEVRDLWPEIPVAMGAITNPVVVLGMNVLEWMSYRAADRLIGLSPGIVQGIQRRGVSPHHVALVPNSCDLEMFDVKSGPFEWPEVVKPGDFVAIFTGTHGMANGLHAVLDAAEVLKMRGRDDIKLVFIGDGKEKASLVRRALDEGLTNCVFMNPVPKMRLIHALHAADIGLMILKNVEAFYYGTSPNKFFDYLASSLPILNNYPGWLAELIEENRCGVVVPPGDPKAFADALENLSQRREELPAMGARALELGKREFDRSQLAIKFESVLVEAAGLRTVAQSGTSSVQGN